MSALNTLIRMHRWQLEEKRRFLAGLEAMLSDFTSKVNNLERQLRREQVFAAGAHEASYSYASFAEETIRRRENLKKSIAELDDQIFEAHDEVATAFQSVKRFEIVLEKKLQREREEAARVEQANENEVALEMYRRNRALP